MKHLVPDLAIKTLQRDLKTTNEKLKTGLEVIQARYTTFPHTGKPISKVVYGDLEGNMRSIRADPLSYGLKDASEPCLKAGVQPQILWSLFPSKIQDIAAKTKTCSDPSTFLFWDDLHPSTAGHAIVARKAEEIIRSKLYAAP